ncbi:MAG TPA: hypothetical protein VH325_07060 [Bryobacteraceae bacterium]|jgi:hypothetical protein|nr:hypothetical protein [Bryobacteraceae bacterium]
MLIKLDLSKMRETRWYEYAIRFLFGGLITAGAGAVAREWGPVVGGLFLAFPAIFPATATLAEKHEKERKENKGMRGSQRGRDIAALEAVGSALGSFGLLFFAAILWRLLPLKPPYAVVAGATIVWIATSVAAWGLRRKFN